MGATTSLRSMSSVREQTTLYGKHRVEVLRDVLTRVPAGRFIDLGAGHGILSRLACDLGWTVTSLDARTDRFPADLLGRVAFRHASVDSDEWSGSEFDLIGCLGLYYHLTFEMQDRLLARCERRPVFLDTHIGTDDRTEWTSSLRGWQTIDGIQGQVFPEPSVDDDRKQNHLLASFENADSFWPTVEGLRVHAGRHGYESVYELVHPHAGAQRSCFLLLADGEAGGACPYVGGPIAGSSAWRRVEQRTARPRRRWLSFGRRPG